VKHSVLPSASSRVFEAIILLFDHKSEILFPVNFEGKKAFLSYFQTLDCSFPLRIRQCSVQQESSELLLHPPQPRDQAALVLSQLENIIQRRCKTSKCSGLSIRQSFNYILVLYVLIIRHRVQNQALLPYNQHLNQEQ